MISIDERTRKRECCHFARVLVEIDLQKPREEYVMFETTGHCSIASIGYERLAVFSSKCGIVGHSDEACRSHPRPTPPPAATNPDKGKQPTEQ